MESHLYFLYRRCDMYMKKTGRMIRIFSSLTAAAVVLGSCPAAAYASSRSDISGAITDFSVELFRKSAENGESILISPFSVLSALSMTANGADGDTLKQMEDVFGLSLDELNDYFRTCISGEEGAVTIANSLWLKDQDKLPVSPEFTHAVIDYYQSEIFEEPMDESTLSKINSWVDENTDGMIQEILDKIQPGTLMYLVNALTFQAKWEEVYEDTDVYQGVFTDEDGNELDTDMMRSTESVWLDGADAEGFMKFYEGGRYAFAALLPDEGVSLDDYVDSLTGSEISDIIESRDASYTVHAEIPKFSSETDMELPDVLKEMGITDAFSDRADFSRMYDTEGNPGVQISEVIHKTFIEVNEQETKAAAATAVGIVETSLAIDDTEKYISLNRPFLYMLVDCDENIPLFIGTVYAPEV